MDIIRSIQNRIYEVRGERVMLDFDIAALYEVETKVFNQAVKRNKKRFPSDFMFQLTSGEWEFILSQETQRDNSGIQDFTNVKQDRWSQTVTTSKKFRPKAALPYAFTEQGVSGLSGVLNSDVAISMHIAIMRTFVAVRKALLLQTDIKDQLRQLIERIGEHDAQLNQIYDAMENLLDEKAAQGKWEKRDRIGFK